MSKIRPMTDEERQMVISSLTYDPDTGLFYHKVAKRGGRVKAGSLVKSKPGRSGYLPIGVGGVVYLAHRLAWLLWYGYWPEEQIDHIDHDRTNNRLSNLRLVTAQGNKMNESKRKDNKSGVTGVYWSNARKQWIACLYQHGKFIHLGSFSDKGKAVEARELANENYGFHENHGKQRFVGAA